MSFLFTENSFAYETKNKLQSGAGAWSGVKKELEWRADEHMTRGPWSVTYDKSPAASGNPHDYFSEGPYWWPNPENPDGPYIRRDGEFNPNVFQAHLSGLSAMSKTVLLLAQAGFYLDESRYSERAVLLLKTWFLDEKTKMNPHFEYAQAIRGRCDGRGIGIIDAKAFIPVVYAAGFLEESGGWEAELSALKDWFAEFLHWMNTSKKGLDEKHYFNNHANWWNTQAATYAAFTGNLALIDECVERFRTVIIPEQTDAEGHFIDELTRTRAYTYSLFNLEATALMCELAYTYRGVDLWHFETPDGKGIGKCLEFMKPYYENLFDWQYKQISMPESTGDKYAYQLAALRLNRPDYARINRARAENLYRIRHASPLGALALQPGFVM